MSVSVGANTNWTRFQSANTLKGTKRGYKYVKSDERSDHELQQVVRQVHLRSHDGPVCVLFCNECKFGGGHIYRKENHEAVSHVRPSRPCKRSGETAASSRSPFVGGDRVVRRHRRKRSRHFQENGSHMGAESQ